MTRKNEVFEWTEKRHDAFTTLKQLSMDAPSLALPDFDKAFILYTDASFVGLGAALHKVHVLNSKEV